MSSILKRKIHDAIDKTEDNILLKAVFTILDKNFERDTYELSDADIAIIEERKLEYVSGKSKTYTVVAVKKKILKNLRK